MKKVLIIVAVLFLSACGSKSKKTTTGTTTWIQTQTDVEFENYTKDLFSSMLEGDPLSINFYVEKPELFGLDQTVYEGIAYENNKQENIDELNGLIAEIKAFKDNKLELKNRVTKSLLIDYFENLKEFETEDFYYYGTNLGSYLGYQANLPVLLTMYVIDDNKDVLDYFSYLRKAEEDFNAITDFEVEKIAYGLSLPNSILNGVIEQIDAFCSQEECYLIPVFEEKIDALDISDEQKASLKSEHKNYINEFINAYQVLKGNIETKLLNKQTKVGSLASFGEKGKKYYQYLIKTNIGTDADVDTIRDELKNASQNALTQYIHNYQLSGGLVGDFAGNNSYKQILDGFISNERIWADFPKLEQDINYNLNYVNEALEDNFSPAAYFASYVDNKNCVEQIIINEKSFAEQGGNYQYTTLAHEGIPGHLFQNLSFKNSSMFTPIRAILNNTGYKEAWAVYSESYILKYASGTSAVKNAYKWEQRFYGYVQAYLDVLVNYDGYNASQLSDELTNMGLSVGDVSSLYNQLIETPTNSLEYYYSIIELENLKQKVQEKLGDDYSDMIFHKFYLEFGPAPFYIIEDYIDFVYYCM